MKSRGCVTCKRIATECHLLEKESEWPLHSTNTGKHGDRQSLADPCTRSHSDVHCATEVMLPTCLDTCRAGPGTFVSILQMLDKMGCFNLHYCREKTKIFKPWLSFYTVHFNDICRGLAYFVFLCVITHIKKHHSLVFCSTDLIILLN